MAQVISSSSPHWVQPFTGLSPKAFGALVCLVARRGGDEVADGRPGRPWALPLADRVLLVAVYWRTNLTMRQVGPLFGVSHSAAHRVVDALTPCLALRPVKRPRRTDEQVAIHADTKLVIAVGEPLPGNRNDTVALGDSGIAGDLDRHVVIADGGYRSNPISGDGATTNDKPKSK